MRAPESQWMNSLTQACIHDYVHDIKIEIRILKIIAKLAIFQNFTRIYQIHVEKLCFKSLSLLFALFFAASNFEVLTADISLNIA